MRYTIECHVAHYRRNNSALWGTFRSREQLAGFDKSGFQPFTQYQFVCANVTAHPLMADMVKASFYVTFEYPLGCVSFSKDVKRLFNSVRTASLRAKAITV